MSESNKFTPGPWFVIEDIRTEGGIEYIAGFNIQTECGDELVGCEGIYGDFGGNRYNANLMAVAPDLLEALENLYRDSMASDFNEHWDSFKLAELAILKVRGKS